PRTRERPDEPFHRKVDDEYGVAGGRLGQQPASQRVQSDGCRGQWESDAVDLLAVVAVDRRQARLRPSGDIDAMARRREHQRARMIGARDEAGLAATERDRKST